MTARAPIIAGKTVILLQVQDTVDSALLGVRSKLKKFSTSIGNIGLDLFRGGLVGTIPIAGILREFQTFEDKILFLSTKLEATDREFKGLTETIRQLGRTTSFTAQEVADGATILAQAGFNAKEVKDSLQPLLDLGRGGVIELSQAGAILANTIRSFGLETKQAGEVASQFIVAARLGTLDVLDLKESIKEMLGTARALNIDLPTTLALLTQLAERSLKGTKAGTSLNTALLQLASKQDVIRKSLKIPLPNAITGDTFIVFLEQLYQKLRKLDNLKQVAVLQSLFNIRGGRAVTALDDIKKILDLQKAIRGAGDEARIAAKKMDSGFGGAIRIAVSAVRDLGIELGGLLAGPITKFLKIVPALSNSARELAVAFPLITLGILSTPPAMLLAGAGLLALSFALSKLTGLVSFTAAVFTSFGGFFFRGFTAQLTSGVAAINIFSRSIKKIDTKLASSFLGVQDPQKVLLAERRVARARAQLRAADLAGNAVAAKKAERSLKLSQGRLAAARQSSFVGRVGATRVPIVGPIEAAFRNLPRLAAVSLAKVSSVVSAGLRGFASFQRGGQSFIDSLFKTGSGSGVIGKLIQDTKNLRLVTLQAREKRIALGKAEVSLVSDYKKSIAIERAARASAKALERQALDSVDVLDRQTILRKKLADVTLELSRAQATSVKTEGRVSALTARGLKLERDRNIAALAAKRSAILSQIGTDAPDVEKLIGRAAIQSGIAEGEKARRIALAKQIRDTRKNVAVARAIEKTAFTARLKSGETLATRLARRERAIARKDSRRPFLRKTTVGIDKALVGTFNVTQKLFKGIFNLIKRVDLVRGLFNIFRTIGGIAKGFLIAANAVRRFVFSFSGLFTIVELLLIFGPRIKFINDAFTRLGKGISSAFSIIFGTLSDASTAFKLFGEGIKSLTRGEGQLGVNQIAESLSLVGRILRSNLTIAWKEFVIAIAPAYDFLRKFISSTIELGSLFASLFGSTIGTGFTGLTDIISTAFTGDSFTDAVAKGFASLNMKDIFVGLATAITGVFDVILGIVRSMFNVVATAMLSIQQVAERFITPQQFRQSTPQEIAAGSGLLTKLKADEVGSGLIQKIITDTNKKFSNGLDSSTKALTRFTDAIEAVHAVNTEVAASQAQHIARLNKLQAIIDANAAVARAKFIGGFDKGLPAVQLGSILQQLPNRIGTAIFDGITKAFSTPKVVAETDPITKIGNSFQAAFEAAKKVAAEAQKRVTPLQQLQRDAGFLGGRLIGLGDERKRLIAEATRAGFLKRNTGDDFSSPERRKQIKDELQKNRLEEKKVRQELFLNKLNQRFGAAGLPQRGSISDVVAATVGSIQTARFNKFRAAGQDPQRQTNQILDNISNQLGGSEAGGSYLKQLTEKAGPLVFQ